MMILNDLLNLFFPRLCLLCQTPLVEGEEHICLHCSNHLPYTHFTDMESDWKRLSTFSAKQNKGTANSLYTSNGGFIDTGFLENKMIKHAFDAYPKVRTGNYTSMETQQEEPVIDYGLVDEEKVNEPVQSVASADDTKIPFGEEKQLDAPEPVQVAVSDDDADGGF